MLTLHSPKTKQTIAFKNRTNVDFPATIYHIYGSHF